MSGNLGKIDAAISLAKSLAERVSPGVDDVSVPKAGQAIPVQHIPVPGFAGGGYISNGASKAFNKLADLQRDKPERAMLAAQRVPESGPGHNTYTNLLEHVGDLTHRMAEHGGRFGREFVGPKVRSALVVLNNAVDQDRINALPQLPEFTAYANEHAKLPVYNEAQRAARNAAVALGRKDLFNAEKNLRTLRDMMDNNTFEDVALKYDPNFESASPDVAFTQKQGAATESHGGYINPDKATRRALMVASGLRRADGGGVDDDSNDLNDMGLYSQAAKAAAALPQAKGTGQQMLASLKGVKPEEMKWSGANDKFADRPSVTKDELAQHFKKSMPNIQETVLKEEPPSAENNWSTTRGAKFAEYNIPGGENYREVLMHLPKSQNEDENFYHKPHWDDKANVLAHLRLSDRKLPDGGKALHMEELQSDWAQRGRKEGFYDPAKPYEAFDPDDGKVVSTHATEEEARIAAEATNHLDYTHGKFHGKVPAAPYVGNTNNWTDLGLKRALLEAARGGHDKLIWTPGEEQAERYDISKHIGDMQATPVSADHVRIVGFAPKEEDEEHGEPIFNEVHHIDKIDDVVGKEVADKIRQRIVMKGEKTGHAVFNRHSGYSGPIFPTPEEAERDRQRYPNADDLEVRPHTKKEFGKTVFLPNSDLKVGAKGMKGYYDDIVPKRLLALAREHDPEATIGSQRIDNHDDPLPSLTITPKMRKSILSKGFKAMARGGDVGNIPLVGSKEKAIRRALMVASSLRRADGGGAWRTVIGGPSKSGPDIHETANPTRILFNAEGPGGVKGIAVPRHMWEGGNGKTMEDGRKTWIPGMKDVNKARAEVYGDEQRDPLNVGKIEAIHKETLEKHFQKPVEQQIADEKAALAKLRAAQHIGKSANTLDEGEKTDTVKHEYDDQGRSYVAYASKGTAGHAVYSSGTGDNEKIHVLNTCPGQTAGCGGGVDENGVVDTRRGICFAPKAEAQYAGAAVRRASHEQAKHDPAMTRDWILAHTGSLRDAARKADKTNNAVLFRPNVLDETDRSTRYVLRGLNKQREPEGLPPIIGNSYGKTNELHDPENGYYITHSNIGPKTKMGASIAENVGKDRQRVRSTISATDASGRDFVNDDGHLTPPKNSYMVTDVQRYSPLDKAMQQAITHAKYWSAPRNASSLSESEKAEGPEGNFDADGNQTSPDKAHYGHTTIGDRRYDYQKQHILHPRLVKVGQNKDGSDHIIPTDSRFKDNDFLPADRFMTKNGKQAGAILMTTPTESTSGLERQLSFTHHVDKDHVAKAMQNNGEYEIDPPEEQEAARGVEYQPPKTGKFAHGGAVDDHDHEEDMDSMAFPEQNFHVQRHNAHRSDDGHTPHNHKHAPPPIKLPDHIERMLKGIR